MSLEAVHLVTDLARTLRPDMERLGIVAPQDPAFDDVAQQILTDIGPNGTVVGRSEIAAWTRI